jgi:hypothetical protein
MSAEIVNLNKFRKAKERAGEERQAELNRAKYGRSKIERQQEEDDGERRNKLLDGAKLGTGQPPSNDTGRESAADNDLDPGTVS